MVYCTIPRIELPTSSTSSAMPPPLSRESWGCKFVILMFLTFAASRSREILAAKGGNHVGREMAGKFILKLPDFHVAFRDLLHAVNLRHGTQ
jgi:hypothetical protein